MNRINEILSYIGIIIESCNEMRKVGRTLTSAGTFLFYFASNDDDLTWEAKMRSSKMSLKG